MNSRLRFRVWIRSEHKMVYQGIGESTKMLMHKYADQYLMQYTGIKDTTGREIYEGDIVKLLSKYQNGESSHLVEVIWQDEPDYNGWSIFKSEDEYEYVGNLLETPGLILDSYATLNKKVNDLKIELSQSKLAVATLIQKNDDLLNKAISVQESDYSGDVEKGPSDYYIFTKEEVDKYKKSNALYNTPPAPPSFGYTCDSGSETTCGSTGSEYKTLSECPECQSEPGEYHRVDCSLSRCSNCHKPNSKCYCYLVAEDDTSFMADGPWKGYIEEEVIPTESNKEESMILLMKQMSELRKENVELKKGIEDTSKLQLLKIITDLRTVIGSLRQDLGQLMSR